MGVDERTSNDDDSKHDGGDDDDLVFSQEFNDILLRKKEYYITKLDKETIQLPPDIVEYFKPAVYQRFIKNFVNPHTPYKRIWLKFDPGTGKTFTSIYSALQYQKVYRESYNEMYNHLVSTGKSPKLLDSLTPTIFVIGGNNTKIAFLRDLYKYPEFGFITTKEIAELKLYERYSESGMQSDVQQLKAFKSRIYQRIVNKQKGGFFKFYGYIEFVNRLFSSDTISLTSLEADTHKRIEAGETITLDDVIKEKIAAGVISVNKAFYGRFRGSFMIVDEAHHLYNSVSKNNAGVAIQYLADAFPDLVCMYLSATPITNMPREIVDIVNLSVDPTNAVSYKQLFSVKGDFVGEELLQRAMYGRIALAEKAEDTTDYPEEVFMGEFIEGVENFTFIKCVMDRVQIDAINSSDMNDEYANDMVYPVYDEPVVVVSDKNIVSAQVDDGSDDERTDDDVVGGVRRVKRKVDVGSDTALYGSDVVWDYYSRLGSDVLKKHGVTINREERTVYGDFMRYENVHKYSAKGHTLIKLLKTTTGAKCFIYTERLRFNGAYGTKRLLMMNGYIEENGIRQNDTLCSFCDVPYASHGKKSDHEYTPTRFVMINGAMSKSAIDVVLRNFNAPENVYGHNYKIIIGNRAAKVSYEFKDVQYMFMLTLPISVPGAIQAFGRVARKNSHVNLPKDKWRIQYNILINYINDDEPSPEVIRYRQKMTVYGITQKVERVLHSIAINGPLNYIERQVEETATSGLKSLDYKPLFQLSPGELTTVTTYNAFQYYEDEISIISVIIKRMFMIYHAISFDDLVGYIYKPPFNMQVNTAVFDRGNVYGAINGMINTDDLISYTSGNISNVRDKYVYVGGVPHVLRMYGSYIVRFRLTDGGNNRIDINSFLQPTESIGMVSASIQKYIKGNIEAKRNEVRLQKFLDNYNKYYNIILDYESDFYIMLLRRIIVDHIDGKSIPKSYAHIMEYFDRFQMIVYVKDVLSYKDVYTKISNRRIAGIDGKSGKYTSAYPSGTPVGYVDKHNIQIYDSPMWISVNKLDMNVVLDSIGRENGVIVGYMDMVGNKVKFKVRQPIFDALSGDLRLVNKGIVCSTLSKDKISDIIERLKLKSRKNRIEDMCEAIRDALIELEVAERARFGKIRYFYLMHELQPIKN